MRRIIQALILMMFAGSVWASVSSPFYSTDGRFLYSNGVVYVDGIQLANTQEVLVVHGEVITVSNMVVVIQGQVTSNLFNQGNTNAGYEIRLQAAESFKTNQQATNVILLGMITAGNTNTYLKTDTTLDFVGKSVLASDPILTNNVANKSYVDKQIAGSTNPANWALYPASQPPDMNGYPISNSPSLTPSGSIVMWAASAAPSGWLLCDGSGRHVSDYPQLFATIGYAYGGSGTNFNMPNLVQRFPRGGTNNLGNTGGADSLTIAEANLPVHKHSIDPPSTASGTESADHTHAVDPPSTASGNENSYHSHALFYFSLGGSYSPAHALGGVSDNTSAEAAQIASSTSATEDTLHTHTTDIASFTSGGKSATHTHTTDIGSFDSGNTGSGTALASLPSYVTVNYIIKY